MEIIRRLTWAIVLIPVGILWVPTMVIWWIATGKPGPQIALEGWVMAVRKVIIGKEDSNGREE